MKLKLLILIIGVYTYLGQANEINDHVIKLPKHYKILNTFSGDLIEDNSFHLIFTKNKNSGNFELFSYLYIDKMVEDLGILESKHAYGLVSFHKNKNLLSILVSYKQKKDNFLKLITINTKSKEVSESISFPHDDFFTSLRKKDKSIIVYKTKDEFLIKQFGDEEYVKEKKSDISDKKNPIKEFFKDNYVDAINIDEYVANGSTSKIRAYQFEDSLVFTKENEEENKTETLEFSLSQEDLSPIFKFFKSNNEFKRSTSYINNGCLYQLVLSKEVGKIIIWNMDDNVELKVIDIEESLLSKVRTNGNFDGITNLLKYASKRKFNPTITVNTTNSGSYLLRVYYVDIIYSYNYDWWWHHHMMWQMNQQMQMQNAINNIPSFGPSIPNDFMYDDFTKNIENRYFELLLDEKGDFSEDTNASTVYKKINKKEYIEKLEDIGDIKYESSCFLKNNFRYIGFSKSFKGFVIQTNELK